MPHSCQNMSITLFRQFYFPLKISCSDSYSKCSGLMLGFLSQGFMQSRMTSIQLKLRRETLESMIGHFSSACITDMCTPAYSFVNRLLPFHQDFKTGLTCVRKTFLSLIGQGITMAKVGAGEGVLVAGLQCSDSWTLVVSLRRKQCQIKAWTLGAQLQECNLTARQRDGKEGQACQSRDVRAWLAGVFQYIPGTHGLRVISYSSNMSEFKCNLPWKMRQRIFLVFCHVDT